MNNRNNKPSNDRQRMLNQDRQRNYKRRRNNNNIISEIVRHDCGRMDQLCSNCGSKFWMGERDQRSTLTSTFFVCCAGGKVRLLPLLKPPHI